MSEGLTRRATGPCRRPGVVRAIRRAPALTVATGAFSTSRRRLRGTATAVRVLISISTKLDRDRMGAGLPSWKPIYFDRTYRQERWLWCSAPTRFTVLPGVGDDGGLSFDRSDLLEQPFLEHLDFSEALRAPRIHDEEGIPRGHAPGKEPNQPAGFQVRCDERCTRQGDTEPRNGRRKQQRLVAVPRSLTGVAVVQANRFKPDGPRLSLIVKKRHFKEVAGCTRQPTTPERRAAYWNQRLVIEFD